MRDRLVEVIVRAVSEMTVLASYTNVCGCGSVWKLQKGSLLFSGLRQDVTVAVKWLGTSSGTRLWASRCDSFIEMTLRNPVFSFTLINRVGTGSEKGQLQLLLKFACLKIGSLSFELQDATPTYFIFISLLDYNWMQIRQFPKETDFFYREMSSQCCRYHIISWEC